MNQSGNARLVVLDPETLAATDGPSVTLGRQGGAWAFSPFRDKLVYAERDRLRLFDLFTFSPEGEVRVAGVGPVAWLSGTIVSVSRAGVDTVEVVKVDQLTQDVLSRRRFAGVVLGARTLPNALVVLLGRENKIATLRVLVAQYGRTRIVRLIGVRGGTVMRKRSQPVVTLRRPALAVDEARGVVYVADPGGMIVELPLKTLKATTRKVGGRFAKVVYGSTRTAVALDSGLLAVTGSELEANRTRAAGLELVDTRTWSSRVVELGATSAWAAGDSLLVSGTTWDSATKKTSSIGLVLLDRSGNVRLRLFQGLPAGVATIVGQRAYVAVLGAPTAVAIDIATGQVVGHAAWPLPQPLVRRSSSD